jgi:hypothetical protein
MRQPFVVFVTHAVKKKLRKMRGAAITLAGVQNVVEPVQGIVVSLWYMHKNTRLVVSVMMKRKHSR